MPLPILPPWNVPSYDVCGSLITESGNQLITESGDSLVTECFVPEASSLMPGRVWKGRYHYWVPTKDAPLYYQDPEEDEDEVMATIAFED